jgi:hypothetical protein
MTLPGNVCDCHHISSSSSSNNNNNMLYIEGVEYLCTCVVTTNVIRLQVTLVDKTEFRVAYNIDGDTVCRYSGPVVSKSTGFLKVRGV